MKNKRLIVFNISSRVSGLNQAEEQDIKKFFEKYGEVVHMKVCEKRDKFAFVEFESLDAAEQAYEK